MLHIIASNLKRCQARVLAGCGVLCKGSQHMLYLQVLHCVIVRVLSTWSKYWVHCAAHTYQNSWRPQEVSVSAMRVAVISSCHPQRNSCMQVQNANQSEQSWHIAASSLQPFEFFGGETCTKEGLSNFRVLAVWQGVLVQSAPYSHSAQCVLWTVFFLLTEEGRT